MISKEDVQQAINESPYPCIVHFDGKTLIELNKGKTIKTDRLAVLVNIEGETHQSNNIKLLSNIFSIQNK